LSHLSTNRPPRRYTEDTRCNFNVGTQYQERSGRFVKTHVTPFTARDNVALEKNIDGKY